MLALLALFGALSAGVMADAFMSSRSSEPDSEEDLPESEGDTAEESADGTSILDLLDQPDTPPEDVQPDFVAGETDADTTDTTDPDVAPLGTPSGYVDDGMPVSDDVADPVDDSVVLSGDSADDILNGGEVNDVLAGNAGSDQLTGRGGDDVMSGGDGRDHLDGGAGNDIMLGGNDDDTMTAGDGDDTLMGGSGYDELAGQAGNDVLSGGEGDDTLLGGEGDDTQDGGAGFDWLAGGEGNDQLVGGAGGDTVDGGAGDDTLWGGTTNGDDGSVDFLNGGAGDDAMHLGAGDYGTGGEGADSFVLDDIYPGSPVAEISDFNPAEDEIVVMYDSALHTDPTLELIQVEGSDDVTLTLDGVEVAMVRDGAGLDLSQVILRDA